MTWVAIGVTVIFNEVTLGPNEVIWGSNEIKGRSNEVTWRSYGITPETKFSNPVLLGVQLAYLVAQWNDMRAWWDIILRLEGGLWRALWRQKPNGVLWAQGGHFAEQWGFWGEATRYQAIHKMVSFCIFSIIKTALDKKIFAIEVRGKVLSLSKFLKYLVMVKIVKIRHQNGHISCINHE